MTSHLDGNVLAGTFGEVFAVDITTAVGQCASCGSPHSSGAAYCGQCGQPLLQQVASDRIAEPN